MRDEGGEARRGDLKKKKSRKRTKPDSIRQNERSIMKTFEEIWALLAPEGEYKRRRGACERLWQGYEPGRQEAIYTRIAGKLARGEFVNQNPYFAIEDNARECVRRRQTMSYAAYYAKYGTTEEKDGWKMVKPQKPGDPPVYYVKGE